MINSNRSERYAQPNDFKNMEKLKISFLLMVLMLSFPTLTLAKEYTISEDNYKKGDCLEYNKGVCVNIVNNNKKIKQKIKIPNVNKYGDKDEIVELRTENTETYSLASSTFLTKIFLSNKYIKDDGIWHEIYTTEEDNNIVKDFLIKGASALLDTSSTNNKDTWLEAYAPTENKGNNTTLCVSNYGDEISKPDRIIINATLPVKSGYSIDKIRLALYKYSSTVFPTFYLNAHVLNRTDWVETQATWNIYKTGSNWTTAGGDYNATVIDSIPHNTAINNWDYWTLQGTGADNPLTKTWGDDLNILIKVDSENRTFYSNNCYFSKNYTTDTTKRPYIEITYSSTIMAQSLKETSNIQQWVINATSTDNSGVSTYMTYSGSSPFFLFVEVVIVLFLFFYLFFKFRDIGRKK